jgi:hypothetical protein
MNGSSDFVSTFLTYADLHCHLLPLKPYPKSETSRIAMEGGQQ